MVSRTQPANEVQRQGALALELSTDWFRLTSEPTRERAVELLTAVDRLPESAWPIGMASQGRAAASMLASLGATAERLDFRNRRLPEVTDQLLHRLLDCLVGWNPASADDAQLLFDAWEQLPSSRRASMSKGLADSLTQPGLEALARLADEALLRTNPEVSSLLSLMHRDSGQATRPRDLRLLAAHLRAALGDREGALELLAQEGAGCSLCAQTAATVLDGWARGEEAQSWLLRAMVGEDPMSIRQFMFDRLWQQGDLLGALEQQAALIEASHDGQHWLSLRSLLEEEAPELLPRAKELLRQRAPDAYMAILLQEGPDEEIALCAQSKAFSAARLWEIAGVLQGNLPAEAAKLYERALQMQGVAAVTRLEMTAFLERVREVTPFFETLGRPTKAHRIARDAAAVSKCGAALKREYEHFFGSKL